MRRFPTKTSSDVFQTKPRVVKSAFHLAVERLLLRFGPPKIGVANGTREHNDRARILLHQNDPTVGDLASVRLHDRISHSRPGGGYRERDTGERSADRRCGSDGHSFLEEGSVHAVVRLVLVKRQRDRNATAFWCRRGSARGAGCEGQNRKQGDGDSHGGTGFRSWRG